MMNFPKISVISPTYNQGQFIEATILSVINQNYPNLEYIVLDAGSTDNTIEILKKYSDKIHFWESKKDKGQADAINKGFNMASGDILCWLNSDDQYLAGTLHFAAQNLDVNKAQILAGNSIHIKNNSALCYGSVVKKNSDIYTINDFDFLVQPSTFYTKKTWEKVGELNLEMTYCFDWDWFIRAKNKNVEFIYSAKYLSIYLLHEAHKSGSGNTKRIEEIKSIYHKNNMHRHVRIIRFLEAKKDKVNRILSWCDKMGLQKIQHHIVKLRYPALIKYRWRTVLPILNSLN